MIFLNENSNRLISEKDLLILKNMGSSWFY